jgi:hypothetical protein
MDSEEVDRLNLWNIAEVRQQLHILLGPVLRNTICDPHLHLPTLASIKSMLPRSLQPTALQLSKPHHAHIDLIPSPKLRDRLIQAEEETAIGFLTDLGAVIYDTEDQGHVTIRGQSYLDETKWEFSAEFLERWSIILLDY